MSSTDRIEKKVTLRAPRSRVWRAVTRAEEFGAWFRVKLDGDFVEGSTTHGKITYPGYEGLAFAAHVERIEPERYFAYRWHPYAIDTKVDYTSEPTTLVEFTLEDAGSDTTRLTIVESGFDKVPPGRRDEAFRSNQEGWAEQARNIERHVTAG
jgi:uncharacterized protein YndB with AHSA1/START domain